MYGGEQVHVAVDTENNPVFEMEDKVSVKHSVGQRQGEDPEDEQAEQDETHENAAEFKAGIIDQGQAVAGEVLKDSEVLHAEPGEDPEATAKEIDSTVQKLCKMDGLGSLSGMAYILSNTIQQFSLVVALSIDWPEGWLEWVSFFKVFSFAWDFVLPTNVSPTVAFITTLLVPLLILVGGRAKYFSWVVDKDAGSKEKEKWIMRHTDRWAKTVATLLFIWLVPAAILGTTALALVQLGGATTTWSVESSAPDAATGLGGDNIVVSSGSGSGSWSSTNGTNASLHTAATFTFVDYLIALLGVWLVAGLVPLAYSVARRSRYRTIVTQNLDLDEFFWGPWLAAEGSVILFLYITAQLGPVVACLGHAVDPDVSGGLFWASVVLGPLYALVPVYLLSYTVYGISDDIKHEDQEEWAEAVERYRTKALAEGGAESFTSAFTALIAPYERKFRFAKPYMMVERMALAAVVVVAKGKVQVWGAVTLAGVNLIVFGATRPYQEDDEDIAEAVGRGVVFATAAIGALLEAGALGGDTGETVLVLTSCATAVFFLAGLGPRRLFQQGWAFLKMQRALARWSSLTEDQIRNLGAEDLDGIDEFVLSILSSYQRNEIVLHHLRNHFGILLKVLPTFPNDWGIDIAGVNPKSLSNVRSLTCPAEFEFDDARIQILAEHLPSMVALSSLNVSNKKFGPDGMATLAKAISSMAAINTITIDSTGPTHDNEPLRTYTLNGLQGGADPNLDLSSRYFGPDDMQFLSMVFTSFPEFTAAIKLLNIASNKCFGSKDEKDADYNTIAVHDVDKGQTGWRAICEALKGTTIETLVLSDIGAGPIALSTLADAINDMAAIRLFDVSKNRFGDEGIQVLSTALKSTGIENLNLADTDMGVAGLTSLVDAVSEMAAVNEITFDGNPITGSKVSYWESGRVRSVDNVDYDLSGCEALLEALKTIIGSLKT
jgi:hypothetical protein